MFKIASETPFVNSKPIPAWDIYQRRVTLIAAQSRIVPLMYTPWQLNDDPEDLEGMTMFVPQNPVDGTSLPPFFAFGRLTAERVDAAEDEYALLWPQIQEEARKRKALPNLTAPAPVLAEAAEGLRRLLLGLDEDEDEKPRKKKVGFLN